jgi:Fe2+ or Zn2+ uptake regulation protein
LPISRKEFESGHIGPVYLILAFLEKNKDSAFTAEEIKNGVLKMIQENFSISLEEVVKTLEILTKEGHVESKDIGKKKWYTVKQRKIGFS